MGLSREQVPSHVTIRQVLMGVDFEEPTRAFRRWADGQGRAGRWLSVDGKSLKPTVSEHGNAQQSFVVLVSAFCQQTGLVEEVGRFGNGRESEVGRVRELLAAMQQAAASGEWRESGRKRGRQEQRVLHLPPRPNRHRPAQERPHAAQHRLRDLRAGTDGAGVLGRWILDDRHKTPYIK